MQPATIKQSIDRIHTWLSNHAPKILASLAQPAEAEKLSELQVLVEETLPAGLIDDLAPVQRIS
jgi:cell wall assembly regulator SMI1